MPTGLPRRGAAGRARRPRHRRAARRRLAGCAGTAAPPARRQRADGDLTTDVAPALALGQRRQHRQEDQLPGAAAAAEQADDQAAAGREPAGRDRGRQHRWPGAGAEPDHHAPEQHRAARLASSTRSTRRRWRRTQRARRPRGGCRARSIMAAANGPMKPNRMRLIGDGEAKSSPAPAELLLQRHHQHARRRADPGRREQRDEGDRDDDPGVVDATEARKAHDDAAV